MKIQFTAPAYLFDNDTTGVREWGGKLSQALTDVGLTKTADTGQIDWTTVTAGVPSTTKVLGYEVRKFTDTQAASSPVIIKLTFTHVLSNVAGTPRYSVAVDAQVGTASNGAGAFVGPTTASTSLRNSGASGIETAGAAPRTSYVCHGEGYFAMLDSSSSDKFKGNRALSVERSRDVLGAATNEHIHVLSVSPNTAPLAEVLAPLGQSALTTVATTWPAFVPTGATTGQRGDDVWTYPLSVIQNAIRPPGLALLACHLSDYPTPGAAVTINMWGVARSYIPLGAINTTPTATNAYAVAGISGLVVWE